MSDRPGEMDERDVDERFASIVAGWHVSAARGERSDDAGEATEPPAADREPADPAAPTDPARPADASERADDDPPPRRPAVNPSPIAGLVPASSWRVVQPPSGDEGTTPAAATAAEDDDEHFEPPSVQLPPQEDLHFWGAVLGLVAGPLCLVYVAMARPFHSTRWFLAGLALSLVGFALLVLRSPSDRDGDDDGARV